MDSGGPRGQDEIHEDEFFIDQASKQHNKSKVTQFRSDNVPEGLLTDEQISHLTRNGRGKIIRYQSDKTCWNVTDFLGDAFTACRIQHLYSGWGPTRVLITEGGCEDVHFDSEATMHYGMTPGLLRIQGQYKYPEYKFPKTQAKNKFSDITKAD